MSKKKGNVKGYVRRKSNAWKGDKKGHKKAAKKGWTRRKSHKSGYKAPKFPAAAKPKRKKSKKRRAANPTKKRKSYTRRANPIKKMTGAIKANIVPFNIASIKAHPIGGTVGGLCGLGGSALGAGAFRAIAAKNEPVADVLSFAGNVIGTELTGIGIKGIGGKVAPGNKLITPMATGARYGGYIGLGVNAIATVIKYATKKTGLNGLAADKPLMVRLREGLTPKGIPVMFKGVALNGLGVTPLLPSVEFKLPRIPGLNNTTDFPNEYGLSADEAALDEEIEALSSYLGVEASEMSQFGLQGDEHEPRAFYSR